MAPMGTFGFVMLNLERHANRDLGNFWLCMSWVVLTNAHIGFG